MNPNGDNNQLQVSDALNLNNLAVRQPEDAPTNLPYLRGETPAVSSFVREDREETYMHTPPVRTNNEPLRDSTAAMRLWCRMRKYPLKQRMQWPHCRCK
ncbi:hypothetical protein LIER_05420 [Lithospermum erythrorhizon]|uniref:Uncharacterized protein n=1 Tax=Lithospermum erythrorhizon TaxID=34254 RepID=A0AAV3P5C4_LITER